MFSRFSLVPATTRATVLAEAKTILMERANISEAPGKICQPRRK